MRKPNTQNCNTSNIIQSSEIGQYLYCSMAWYLHRCGYQPDSIRIDEGTQKHINFGNQIDSIQHQMKRFHRYAIVSLLFFILAVSSIFLEVIL